MRPDRGIVKKAISDAGGNLSRAAIILGCTRQTLYTWCYQLGLERFAGIRLDTRAELDTRECMDRRPRAAINSDVYPGAPDAPNLHVVPSQTEIEFPIQATVKLPDSLWKRVKIEAIREGCTVSDLVRRALEAAVVAPKVEEPRVQKGAGERRR